MKPADWLPAICLTLTIAFTSTASQQQPQDGPLSPEDWTLKYTCNKTDAQRLRSLFGWQNSSEYVGPTDLAECDRDSTAWMLKYADELEPAYRFLIREKSLDERLANLIYGTTVNIASANYFKYTFRSGSAEEDARNMRLVAGPQVDENLCALHLKQMVDQVDELELILARKRRMRDETANGNSSGGNQLGSRPEEDGQLDERHFRLARVLDSFGRYESGSLSATPHLVGSYRQCLGSQLLLSTGRVQTRFCWARNTVARHVSVPVKARIAYDLEDGDYKLTSGVCLPETCHSLSLSRPDLKHLVKKLVDTQLKLPQSIYVDETLSELESVFCLVDEQSQFARIPTSGKVCLAVIASWLLLVVGATLFNWHEEASEPEKSVQAAPSPFLSSLLAKLDLRAAWRELTDSSQLTRRDNPVELDVLNPTKVLVCVYVVYAHSCYMALNISTELVANAAQVETDRFYLVMLASAILVNTFFVMSGLLLTYIALVKIDRVEEGAQKSSRAEQRRPLRFLSYWFAISASRYLRLVPMFALAFWFKRTVFIYLGSGPLWDSGLNRDTMYGGCLYSSSYLTPFWFYETNMRTCILQGWTISNELFFSLVLPPFVILMLKYPKTGITLAAAASLGGWLLYLNALHTTIPAAALWELREMRAAALHIVAAADQGAIFVTPIYRIGVVLIGSVAGLFLFRYQKKNSDWPTAYKWPRWFRWHATILSVAFMIFLIFASSFGPELKRATYPSYRSAVVPAVVFNNLLWSLASAVLLIRMTTDWKGNLLMRLSAHKSWRIGTRLLYAVLLLHFDLIFYQFLSGPTIEPASKLRAWAIFSSSILLVVPLSAAVFVLFERPIDQLTRLYFR